MTRYQECLRHVRAYVESLKSTPGLNASAIEGLVEAHVCQPAYDVTFRRQLVRDALDEQG